jgi:hypothetical protein
MTKLLHLEKFSEESRALFYMAAIVCVGGALGLFFAVRGLLH